MLMLYAIGHYVLRLATLFRAAAAATAMAGYAYATYAATAH